VLNIYYVYLFFEDKKKTAPSPRNSVAREHLGRYRYSFATTCAQRNRAASLLLLHYSSAPQRLRSNKAQHLLTLCVSQAKKRSTAEEAQCHCALAPTKPLHGPPVRDTPQIHVETRTRLAAAAAAAPLPPHTSPSIGCSQSPQFFLRDFRKRIRCDLACSGL
jgi:hypothetical protein